MVIDTTWNKQLKGIDRSYRCDVFTSSGDGKTRLLITESRKTNDGGRELSGITVFPEDAKKFAEMVSRMAAEIAS